MVTFAPIDKPGRIIAPAPMNVPVPSFTFPHKIAPGPIEQKLPISLLCPMLEDLFMFM
jgi:hypothetical protein